MKSRVYFIKAAQVLAGLKESGALSVGAMSAPFTELPSSQNAAEELSATLSYSCRNWLGRGGECRRRATEERLLSPVASLDCSSEWALIAISRMVLEDAHEAPVLRYQN